MNDQEKKQTRATMDSRTHAQKRKEDDRQAMRTRVQGMQLLNVIQADLESEVEPDKLQVVKWKTDVRLKLLDKILPDLKAQEIEHSGGITVTHEQALDQLK